MLHITLYVILFLTTKCLTQAVGPSNNNDCENKKDFCKMVADAGEDIDAFCSAPHSITSCPKLCDPKCKISDGEKNVDCGNGRMVSRCTHCTSDEPTKCGGNCAWNKENLLHPFCDAISNDKCDAKTFDKECVDGEWWCPEHNKCIHVDAPCNERCYYYPNSACNIENFLQINIPAYCKNNQTCNIQRDICNLHNSKETDLCLIAKDVCTNDQFDYRKCMDHSKNIRCQGHWPGQCIPRSLWDDGVYDCLDRSDEKIEKILLDAEIFKPFDFKRFNLRECPEDEDEKYGLISDLCEGCIPYSDWCTEHEKLIDKESDPTNKSTIFKHKCPIINDRVLCSNITYWNDRIRVKSSCDYPCSGTYPGQCSSQKNVCDGDTSVEPGNCFDKTDEICKKTELGADMEQKCDLYKYWYCDNNTTCIHKDLICNHVYNCEDKSDENTTFCGTDKCTKETGKSYSCSDKYTPNIKICASRCDNVIECFDGADESGCELDSLIQGISVAIVIVTLLIAYLWNRYVPCTINQRLNKIRDSKKDVLQDKANGNIIKMLRIFREYDKDISTEKKQYAKNFIESLHSKTQGYSNQLVFFAGFVTQAFQQRKSKVLQNLLYECELTIHNDNRVETDECMKSCIGTNDLCQNVIDSHYTSMIDRITSCFKKCRCCMNLDQYMEDFLYSLVNIMKHKYCMKIMAIKRIIFHYFDLVKDVILLMAICYAVNVYSLSFESFSTQVIIAYVLSICLPLLFNWISIAFYHLEESCGRFEDKEKFPTNLRILMQIVTLILIPFIPGILIFEHAVKKEKISDADQKIQKQLEKEADQLNIERILELSRQSTSLANEKRKLKSIVVMCTKCELFEVLFQTCITIVLLSMNRYSASLTSGELQGFFKTFDWYLPIALLLSIRKLLSVSVKVQKLTKDGFQQFVGAIIYGLYGIIVSVIRVCCVILYFAMPLGLFNLLVHNVYETAEFQWRDSLGYSVFNDKLGQYETVFLKNINSTLVSHGDKSYHYTQYTGLTLKGYYIVFLLGMLAHFMIVFIMDVVKNKKIQTLYAADRTNEIKLQKCDGADYDYENDGAATGRREIPERFRNWNWFSSCLRAFTSYVIPEVSIDWDEDVEFEKFRVKEDAVQRYKRRWKLVKREYMVLIVLQAIENFLLIIPVMYTYTNVKARHQFLEQTIGPVPLESSAMENMEILAVLAPIVVLLSIPIQFGFIWAFNNYGHPWSIMFQEFNKKNFNLASMVTQASRIKQASLIKEASNADV